MPAYQTLPFTKEDVPPPVEKDSEAILRTARVAGAALRQLRENHGISLGSAAQLLNLAAEDLSRAEVGQLIEVTRRGRLIDMASVLLLMLSVVLERDMITLDRKIG